MLNLRAKYLKVFSWKHLAVRIHFCMITDKTFGEENERDYDGKKIKNILPY